MDALKTFVVSYFKKVWMGKKIKAIDFFLTDFFYFPQKLYQNFLKIIH